MAAAIITNNTFFIVLTFFIINTRCFLIASAKVRQEFHSHKKALFGVIVTNK